MRLFYVIFYALMIAERFESLFWLLLTGIRHTYHLLLCENRVVISDDVLAGVVVDTLQSYKSLRLDGLLSPLLVGFNSS